MKKLKTKTLFVVFTFLVLIFSACQSGVLIAESNLPVPEHRRAVVAAIGEPRLMSQNGRELTSPYHDRNFKYLEVTAKTKRRYYTKVIILGARRPYDVQVQVRIEARNPETNVFQDVGLDENLSMTRAKAIKEMLNQSREKVQTIDGSNPF